MGIASGGDIEHNKHVGPVSTVMIVLTSKDGVLLSQFDNINEGNANADFDSASLKKMMINNHDLANKGKIKCPLPLEHIFGFCKPFKKITKNQDFNVTLRTVDLQDIIFTSIGDNINVIISSV